MAIFSRRTIQRLINENSRFTGREELGNQVKKLNLKKNIPVRDAISAEWDIIILNVLSKFGDILHHEKFNGSRPIDIYLQLQNSSFVAEIVSVNNEGKNKQNAVEELTEWLNDTVSKFGYNPNNFELHLDGKFGSKLYKTKTSLIIPTLHLINNSDENLLGTEFINFLKEIPLSSNSKMTYRDSKYDIFIVYSKRSKYSSVTYPSYNEIISLTNDALVDKADQLKSAQSNLPLGIFICDGGFESFNSMSSLHGYSMNEVIRYFLKSYQDISFVFSTTIERYETNGQEFRVKTKIYEGEAYKNLNKEIHFCLNELQKHFPCPQMTSISALNIFNEKYSNQGKPFLGCYSFMKNEIRISSRAIQELLSGEISQEEFFDIHGFDFEKNSQPRNPFSLLKNKSISEVVVETGEHEADDDWLVFKFDKDDPGKSKFTLPAP